MAPVPAEWASNLKRLMEMPVPPAGSRLVKLAVYLDGLGSGVGSQVARPVMYNGAFPGTLTAVGSEVVVADGQPPGWVDFRFLDAYPSGVEVLSGVNGLGLIFGENTNTIRLYSEGTAPNGRYNVDTYSDGPSASFGAVTVATANLLLQPVYVKDWVRPDVDDLQLSRLPYNETQEAFATTGTVVGELRLATAGWYGTRVDPERGAVAVVRSDGPLADLVGERLKVTSDEGVAPRSVYVYCHSEGVIAADEDLALPPGLFARLAQLSRDAITVRVEVLG